MGGCGYIWMVERADGLGGKSWGSKEFKDDRKSFEPWPDVVALYFGKICFPNLHDKSQVSFHT